LAPPITPDVVRGELRRYPILGEFSIQEKGNFYTRYH